MSQRALFALVVCALAAPACASLSEAGGGQQQDARASTPAAGDAAAPAVALETARSDDQYLFAPDGACDEPAARFVVQYVNDGDTMTLRDGAKVRFLGIDSAELSAKECQSQEATDFLRRLMPRDTIACLLADPMADNVDTYGRLLRYVYVSSDLGMIQVNARAVRLGHARVFYAFLEGLAYAGELKRMAELARNQALGGWGACSW